MITELLLTFFFSLTTSVVALLPVSQPPDWMTSTSSTVATLWSYGSDLSAWLPWGMAGTVMTAVLACLLVGFGIKVVRIVASYFLAGGGSAG